MESEGEREQKRTRRERMRLMQIIALQSITRACAIETKSWAKPEQLLTFIRAIKRWERG